MTQGNVAIRDVVRQNPEESKYFSPRRKMFMALHARFFAALEDPLLNAGHQREVSVLDAGFSMPDVHEKRRRQKSKFSTPGSRRLASTRSNADERSKSGNSRRLTLTRGTSQR
jgi:hypothetical protein